MLSKEEKIKILLSKCKLASVGKLKTNIQICKVYLIPPKNKVNETLISVSGKIVGTISDGKMHLNEFAKKIYGNDNFTYDVLSRIMEEINKEAEDGDNGKVSKKQGKQLRKKNS